MSDAQATELAVGNPDAAMVVPLKQPSIDYTAPQGNSVSQDSSSAPNKITFADSLVPDGKKEKAAKTDSNGALSSSAAALAVEHPSQPDSSEIRSSGTGSVDSEAAIKALHETRELGFLQIEETDMAKVARKPIACTPADCSSRGRCHRGRCFCDPGFGGDGCDTRLPCPGPDCSGNGECANGKCVCSPGFSGDACDVEVACASGCNGHGICKWGKCFCDIGFAGVSCEQETGKSLCPSACNANGLCEAGRCFCKSEYTGHDCSIKVDLREASALTASVRAQTEATGPSDAQSNRLTVYGALSVTGVAFVVGLAVAAVLQRVRTRYSAGKSVKGGADSSMIFMESTQMAHSKLLLGDGIDRVGSLGVLEH